jgi:hypothetical protein
MENYHKRLEQGPVINQLLDISLDATMMNYAYSNITVYTSEQINSNLVVLGSTTLEGATVMSNAVDVFGHATLNSNLTVLGSTSLRQDSPISPISSCQTTSTLR